MAHETDSQMAENLVDTLVVMKVALTAALTAHKRVVWKAVETADRTVVL